MLSLGFQVYFIIIISWQMKTSKSWLVSCLQSGDENLLERREEALAEDRNQGVRRYLLQPDSGGEESDLDDEASESAEDNDNDDSKEIPLSDSDSEAGDDTPVPVLITSDKKQSARLVSSLPLLRRHPLTAKDKLKQQLQQEVLRLENYL